MSLASILLIVFSAVLHVIVHVLLKRTKNRAAFIWWMWLWVIIVMSPVLWVYAQPIPKKVWAIMLVSAFFDSLYYKAITRAYQTGDLSLVYPLSRGVSPVFILCWSLLFLRESPTLGGSTGVILIALGLIVLNMPGPGAWQNTWRSLNQPASRWALLAGLCVSFYTTIDRVGISHISPIFYTYLTMATMVLFMTPGTIKEVGWQGIIGEFKESKYLTIFAGILSMAAYTIVLVAMSTGLPTSYAGATREISAVFSTIIGILILKEQGTLLRVCGSVLVTIGAATIALLG